MVEISLGTFPNNWLVRTKLLPSTYYLLINTTVCTVCTIATLTRLDLLNQTVFLNIYTSDKVTSFIKSPLVKAHRCSFYLTEHCIQNNWHSGFTGLGYLLSVNKGGRGWCNLWNLFCENWFCATPYSMPVCL